jgi:hypothetical protein
MNTPPNEPAYIYRAYGTTIGSVFELPAMLEGDGPVDLHITAGVPLPFDKYPDDRLDPSAIDDGAIALTVGDIATFLLRDGTEVIVRRGPDHDENTLVPASQQRLVLFTSGVARSFATTS